MKSNSLWFRLIASSAVISAVLLLSAAFLLNAIFVHALERNFDQRLSSAMDGLLASIDLSPDGKPVLQNQLADSRFALPLSGWYWQVRDTSGAETYLTSPSLLEQHIPTTNNDASTDAAGLFAYSAQDAKGTHLRVIHQDISLFGKPQKYDIRVAGNFSELSGEITSFQHTLFGLLAGLGLALLGALVLQVRYALRPLAAMRYQMNDIRGGKIDHLDENYPTEIQPLATELNLLVDANREIVNRARMQVGNLAHALKTPLSVITNEIGENASSLANKMREQLGVMR
ncbi:MAG: sensor histidine kinase, partial [Pseudomonadota bacterium]|nr:sensor histidine kinase [Pseudomonadota bacterium]